MKTNNLSLIKKEPRVVNTRGLLENLTKKKKSLDIERLNNESRENNKINTEHLQRAIFRVQAFNQVNEQKRCLKTKLYPNQFPHPKGKNPRKDRKEVLVE